MQPGDLRRLFAQHEEHGISELGQLREVVQIAQVEHLKKIYDKK